MPEKPTITTTMAAQRLGVSGRRVLQFIKEERLRAQQFGRDWLIYESSLDSFHPLKPGPKPKRKRGGK